LVFIKQNVIKLIKKKTKTGSNRPISVRFLGQKLVQTGLALFIGFARFLQVWLGFFGFSRFWLGFLPVWLHFFPV